VNLRSSSDHSNKDLASFFDSIKFDDLSASFKTDSKDAGVQRLHHELNEAITKLRNSRQEKDSEYLFYKNIVMHVGIGLIIFKEDTGKIEIFNSAARKLLKINRAETVHDLKEVSDTLPPNINPLLDTPWLWLPRFKSPPEIILIAPPF